MENSAYLIRNPDVVLREEDEDGALLFHPDTNNLQVINTTGCHLWHHCDGTRDLDALTESLRHEFDGVPEEYEVVVGQVKGFFDGLILNGFVDVVGETESAP